ncbi:hypothetical protein FQN57_005325 [Myotisia sp. PD_48]|nr:hypothetical protein FQN57_005325 [Myotisia sp. PD_48]
MASDESTPRYKLQVTAGPGYDTSSHRIVHVNADKSLAIETEHAIVNLCVRIQDFEGLPPSSPNSTPYFSHPSRQHDQYSISISLLPKRNLPGAEVVFGNDFDRPIRDRLPPGSNYAFKFVKWWIDPGLEGDAYADKPYLYGPALSSWNYFRICEKHGQPFKIESGNCDDEDEKQTEEETGGDSPIRETKYRSIEQVRVSSLDAHDEVIEEGAEGSGEELRALLDIPADSHTRKKFFLEAQNLELFEFEAGRVYKADFCNPYIGFNDFSIRLPGINIPVTKYIDEKNHELRYVLKNKNTGDTYFVLMFTLLLAQREENSQTEAERGDDNDNGESEVD